MEEKILSDMSLKLYLQPQEKSRASDVEVSLSAELFDQLHSWAIVKRTVLWVVRRVQTCLVDWNLSNGIFFVVVVGCLV